LNIANGADGTPVTTTDADADAVLSLYTGKLPYGVRTIQQTASEWSMRSDAGELQQSALTPGCAG